MLGIYIQKKNTAIVGKYFIQIFGGKERRELKLWFKKTFTCFSHLINLLCIVWIPTIWMYHLEKQIQESCRRMFYKSLDCNILWSPKCYKIDIGPADSLHFSNFLTHSNSFLLWNLDCICNSQKHSEWTILSN